MRIHSLLIASAITTVSAFPAMAQQSTTIQRYAILFKYTDQAVKAMTESIIGYGSAERNCDNRIRARR
jgi:hypothetical protein